MLIFFLYINNDVKKKRRVVLVRDFVVTWSSDESFCKYINVIYSKVMVNPIWVDEKKRKKFSGNDCL